MSNAISEFKTWYDAVWLDDNPSAPIPTIENARPYEEYMAGYTIAHGAWQQQQSTINALQSRIAELEALLDSRPAINAALTENYVQWPQSLYSLTQLDAIDAAMNKEQA